MDFEFETTRTGLANAFAAAGAELLGYQPLVSTAVAPIPDTQPQKYAVAGTLTGILQMAGKMMGEDAAEKPTGDLTDEQIYALWKQAIDQFQKHEYGKSVHPSIYLARAIARAAIAAHQSQQAQAIEHAARICEASCVCDNGEVDEDINRVLRNRAAQIRGLFDLPASQEGAHAALPKGAARSSDGTTYHNIAEIYHRFEEGESLHEVLDEKSVPRADAEGKGYSLVGRVEWLAKSIGAHAAPEKVREAVARAIWNIRREDEDRCDMELEDMGPDHSVWNEADAAIRALKTPASAEKGGAA